MSQEATLTTQTKTLDEAIYRVWQPKRNLPITAEEYRASYLKLKDWCNKLEKLEAKVRARYEVEHANCGCHYTTDPAWHMCDRRRRQLWHVRDELRARLRLTFAIRDAEKKQEQEDAEEWVLV